MRAWIATWIPTWLAALLLALLAAGSANSVANSASALDPTGEWDTENGDAHIRIVDCAGRLWGVVSWAKAPGNDIHNPDPSLRSRPTVGMPVLLNMKPGDDPGTWEGEVYNAKNGRTYDASIEIKSADTLHVEGCALAVLCGGEDWKRLVQSQPAQADPRNRAGTTGTPAGAPTNTDVCAGIAGRTH
jgi:uncharacterized protein (DUF2147 family)